MKTRELFLKDPLSWTLLNGGVSSNNSNDLDTLRYELETFVCQGEYQTGLIRILQGYLSHLDKDKGDQIAAWVSGFYGSGKSHLVKMLRYLWTDFTFPDGSTARSLSKLPAEVKDLLKELSTRGKQCAGLHAAGGTLKAGTGDVRLRLLALVFQSAGLPQKLSMTRLVMDLRDDETLDAVRDAIAKTGKDPDKEFQKFYTSKALHEAYLASYPHLGEVRAVGEALLAQYPAGVDAISIEDMIQNIRRAIGPSGELPCTILVLDEVQQHINNSADIANDVQEVVEACQKRLDGRVLVVGSGQSALTDTPALQRLMGRFPVKVHLKDNDVEKVVRTVVLQKKPDRKKDIEQMVNKHSGEIARQLKATKIATRDEDHDAYAMDYPLLPVRRRFWEHVLHSVDPTGSTAQMRTQLRVTHEACRSVADKPLGAVIPADFLYDQLSNDLVISGEMQKRFQEIIEEQKGKADGALRSRICALVFLINKVCSQEVDIGVRAHAEHLADLLTDDLAGSAAQLREKIPGFLADLVAEGVLMDVEGEYHLQTTEGASWESEFRKRFGAIKNNEPQIAAQRAQLLSKAIQKELSGASVFHGAAREKRRVVVHHGMEPPPPADGITVWIRDGFSESEAAVISDIQGRSVDDATVHVLIPKAKTDELRGALASSIAAEETLNFKGSPTGQEGKDARASMVTRQASEAQKVGDLIDGVLEGARVFLSGGQELSVMGLKEAVEDAAQQVLGRLYPKFNTADSANWPTVWKKAKEGNPSALEAVGHKGDPDKQPVAAEVLKTVGAGKKGADVVAMFTAPPYGWPKDAIDGCFAALLVSGHLGARINGQPVKLADLDQRKASQADYRVEHPVLTAAQKLRIRKLYQDAGQPFQPGDESGAAPGFIKALKDLARGAGGEAPAPEPPHDPLVTELEGHTGNDLLFALFEKADAIAERVAKWKALAAKIAARKPAFDLASQLLTQTEAAGIAGMEDHASALDAVRQHRSLLDDPDPVEPVLKGVGAALRAAVTSAHARYGEVLDAEMAKLNAHAAWTGLPEAKRTTFLAAAGVASRSAPVMGTDEDLLAALKACDISTWGTHADAIPTRCAQALAAAIKEAEPKARRVTLPSATIRNPEELDAWMKQARSTIEAALKDGPVIT